jgi:tripartite-type tricarboxylate transporter receptor subunit TctC
MLWALHALGSAHAQLTASSSGPAYPACPVRTVVPLAAGGGMDTVTRALSVKLSEAFGHTFVVDNRPGAGSQIALDITAAAAPDGHTLMMIHIPYKGMGAAYADLIGGQVQSSFPTVISSIAHINSGRLRPLAVTPARRVPALPQVPTFAEAGVKGVVVYSVSGTRTPGNRHRPLPWSSPGSACRCRCSPARGAQCGRRCCGSRRSARNRPSTTAAARRP